MKRPSAPHEDRATRRARRLRLRAGAPPAASAEARQAPPRPPSRPLPLAPGPLRGRSVFSSGARWILYVSLLVIPLAIWPKVVALISAYILVKYTLIGVLCGAILALAALALWAEDGAGRRARRWLRLPAAWGLLATLAAVWYSARRAPVPAFGAEMAWRTLAPLGVAIACGWLIASLAHARRAAALMVAGGLGVALVGFTDAMGILPIFKWLYGMSPEELLAQRGAALLRSFQGLARGRFLSTLGNPAYVGGFLVVPVILTAGWLMSGWRGERPRGWRAAGGWAALLPLVLTLVASATREAWVGVMAGLIAWVWLGRRAGAGASRMREAFAQAIGRGAWKIPAGLFALLALLLVIFSTPNPLNRHGLNVAARFTELTDIRSDSIRERILFATLAGRMFGQRPLTGWGPGMYGVRFYPSIEEFIEQGPPGPWLREAERLQGRVAENAHNDFFQFGAEHGALGLAALVWLIAAIYTTARRELRPPAHSSAPGAPGEIVVTFRIFAAAWFAALATLFTSFPLHTPARAFYFWTLTGILVSLTLFLRHPELSGAPASPAAAAEILQTTPADSPAAPGTA